MCASTYVDAPAEAANVSRCTAAAAKQLDYVREMSFVGSLFPPQIEKAMFHPRLCVDENNSGTYE